MSSSFARSMSTALDSARSLAGDLEVAADPGALLGAPPRERPPPETPSKATPPAKRAAPPASKGAFVFGVGVALVAAFELGAHPATFYQFYT